MKTKQDPITNISNCTFTNAAAPMPIEFVGMMTELARAAIANAEAIKAIAASVKGAEAHMDAGIKMMVREEDEE